MSTNTSILKEWSKARKSCNERVECPIVQMVLLVMFKCSQQSYYAADVPMFHKLERAEVFLSHDCTEVCPGFTERTNTGSLWITFLLLLLLFSFLDSIITIFLLRVENRARIF
jgi:hypothetical protein